MKSHFHDAQLVAQQTKYYQKFIRKLDFQVAFGPPRPRIHLLRGILGTYGICTEDWLNPLIRSRVL